MSDARLTSAMRVAAMVRRVHGAGGSAMVLRRGDADAGAILVIAMLRGRDARIYERGIGPDGMPGLVASGPGDSDEAGVADYWQRRASRDPDLWVIELDIAQAERFAAETI